MKSNSGLLDTYMDTTNTVSNIDGSLPSKLRTLKLKTKAFYIILVILSLFEFVFSFVITFHPIGFAFALVGIILFLLKVIKVHKGWAF